MTVDPDMGGRFFYRVGADFQVEPGKAAVFRAGRWVHVGYQTFKVLMYLLERRGQLVTEDELMTTTWRGRARTDETIAQSIAELRRLFDDPERSSRFIKTAPKSGFVFVAPVDVGWLPAVRPALSAGSDSLSIAGVQHRWWGTGPALPGLEKW